MIIVYRYVCMAVPYSF